MVFDYILVIITFERVCSCTSDCSFQKQYCQSQFPLRQEQTPNLTETINSKAKEVACVHTSSLQLNGIESIGEMYVIEYLYYARRVTTS